MVDLNRLLKGTQELIQEVDKSPNRTYVMSKFDSCILGTLYGVSARSWNRFTKELFGVPIDADGDRNLRNKDQIDPNVYAVSTLITTHANPNGVYCDDYVTREQWLGKARKVEADLTEVIEKLQGETE